MPDHAVGPRGAAGPLGEPVAMEGQDLAAADVEHELVPRKLDSGLLGPEGGTPAVVVAAGHRHRHHPGHPGQRRGYGKGAAGNYLPVGKPELEEVAGDEQGVAEVGRGFEEGEEGRLGLGRRAADVRVCDDEKTVAGHREE